MNRWRSDGRQSIAYQYDDRRRRTQVTDPGGRRTVYRFTETGTLEEEISSTGSTLTNALDPSGGLLATFRDGILLSALRIDATESDQRVHVQAPGSAAMGHEFSLDGRMQRVVDAAGQQWTSEYGPRGELIRTVTPGGELTEDTAMTVWGTSSRRRHRAET